MNVDELKETEATSIKPDELELHGQKAPASPQPADNQGIPSFRPIDRCVKIIVVGMISVMFLSLGEKFFFFLDPIFQYRFQFAMTLTFAAGLLFFSKQFVWGLASLIVAAPTLATAAAFYLPVTYEQAAYHAETRRFLCFNIWGLNEEFDKILAMIEREDPDVICFVEVVKPAVLAFKELETRYPYVGIDPNHRGYGCRLYSKYPITQESDPKKSPSITDAPLVCCNIHFPERTVTCYLTHLVSPTELSRVLTRNQQFIELAELVSKEPLLTICCGDFNCTNWSVNLKKFLTKTGMKDSRKGHGLQPSWPAMFGTFLFRVPIDHVFVSPEIAVTFRKTAEAAGSDHLPVIVDLKFPLSEDSGASNIAREQRFSGF
ncbi:MAG TPA: endonuclease/exonuclease/phosphatase family protein [Pirellulaceae bacterium]|nr:endonuclease/exonuclease/phosphatase family protein [Pirellulaceae bacterium]HMO93126.1 endonuclease/exonuclease/phosphatase family protein [Pirellulaceae bacterium]HMP70315.1 endonuclease/exonuclease/phosphatase family protein [Pirellulaceae bacterium]